MDSIIYDNDMGNDIDDAFAQAMAAQAHAKGLFNLALTVSSNPNPASVAMIEAINRHYGVRCPLGIHKSALRFATDVNGYCFLSAQASGVKPEELEVSDAVPALRKALFALPGKSVRVVATGFSTNLAGLLESAANFQGDAIPFSGVELVKRKVQFLSIMAGDFDDIEKEGEFNVKGDRKSAQTLYEKWPTEIYVSPYNTGLQVQTDWTSLKSLMKDANPVKFAYNAYFAGKPVKRPSWDQTSMLFALEPACGLFKISSEGDVEILDSSISEFHPRKGGKCRILSFDESHSPKRVAEVLEAQFYKEQ